MNGIPDNSEDTAEGSMTGMNALTQRHEELRAKNAVKIGILSAYLVDKLEGVGCGDFWIGGVFPDEVIYDDLGALLDTEVDKIHQIGDRYFATICQKLGIEIK